MHNGQVSGHLCADSTLDTHEGKATEELVLVMQLDVVRRVSTISDLFEMSRLRS